MKQKLTLFFLFVGFLILKTSTALPAQFEAMRLDGSSPFLSFYDGATPKGLLWNNNGNMTLGTFATNPTGQIKFITNNAERVIITSEGNVAVGTTSPVSRLDVRSIGNAIHGKSEIATGVYGISTYDKGVYGVSVNNSGVHGFSENAIGVVGSGKTFDFFANGPGVHYGYPVSLRWQKNIRNISNPLEKIAALRGVYFDCDEAHGGQHDVGFIAEEVGKVMPEIVAYEENGVDAIGMDYAKMTPLLVEAVNVIVKDYNERFEKQNAINEQLSKKLKLMEQSSLNLSNSNINP